MTPVPPAGSGGNLLARFGRTHVRAALAAALDAAAELLGASRVAILLPDSTGALRTAARRGFGADALHALAPVLAGGAGGECLAAGGTLAPGGGQPPELAAWCAAHGERGLVAVPLSVDTVRAPMPGMETLHAEGLPPVGPLGVMGAGAASSPVAVLVLGFDPPARATPARLAGATRLAALAAVAVTAARQVQSLTAAASDTAPAPPGGDLVTMYARQVELAQALTEVLAVTGRARDIAAASDAAARIVLRVTPGTDIVNVWLLNRDQGVLERIAAAGAVSDNQELLDRLALDERVGAARTLHEERIIVWQQPIESWPPMLRRFARLCGLVTVAHVPMHSSGQTVGVLTLGSCAPRTYAAPELAFLTTLAGQLAGQLEVLRGHVRVEDEQRRLLSLIDTLPEGLLIVRPDGQITQYNQAALAILGTVAAEQSWPERVQAHGARTPDGRPFLADDLPLVRALRGETVKAVEMLVRRPDGVDVPLLVSAGPLRGPDGGVGGALSVFQDISRLKELDRLKDDFINTVSHELRTPTTTIRGGALTLLRRGDRLDDETRRQLLEDIAEESERLQRLVEDLLSLSRSQAGMRMAPEPVRLHRLVNKVILDLGARGGSRALTVDVPPGLPVVDADAIAIEQVLRNLLENAMIYSPRGGRVEVTAEVCGDQVVVSVLDHGPGLTEADLHRVFEPFYRTEATVRSGAGGAGLGLAVCRRLVELHGGRIWAEHRPGGGAAFRFTLPVVADTED